MLTHIVLWKLHANAAGRTRDENAAIAKARLEALAGKIPGLIHIEVGSDVLRSPASADLALYCQLESRDALDVYQDHPEHVAIKGFMAEITADRTVIDYLSDDAIRA